MISDEWYSIDSVTAVDTPALVIYKDRVQENISRLINSVDRVERLRPHIKTHKSSEVTSMLLQAGIKKFKCATISEAEMLADTGAPDILLAYQPVGPKADRLVQLMVRFPQTVFSCLIDDLQAAIHLSRAAEHLHQEINAYIDLNVGMNRTGIRPEDAPVLFEGCRALKALSIIGLHAYDGHLRDPDFNIRTKQCDAIFESVERLRGKLEHQFNVKLKIVAGGTPTYFIHSKRKDVECSPGTFIYWDKGYEQILTEQHFLHAALVITRVISKPAAGIICLDLGHKAIASENPLADRVFFLNGPDLQPIGHSEEHMVLRTGEDSSYHIGDVLYGIPYHICPTVALYDEAIVIEKRNVMMRWNNLSRKRKITI